MVLYALLIAVRPFDMNSLMSHSSIKRSDKINEGTSVRIVEPSHFGMNSSPRKLKIDSLVDPSKAEGPSHLLQLRGHCFKLENEEYTFEFCPFYNVSQREVSTRWNPYYGLLGVWSGWIFDNTSDYITGMQYTHGDTCGEGGYKKSEIFFQCSEVNNSLHWANETERCMFKFIFLTQLVCREEWLAVFPHLKDSNREAWLRVQLDHSLGYLTEKGVCHVKKEILKEVGWVHELNLTRLKNHEAQQKNGGQSLYDRSSYIRSQPLDCSGCEKELKMANNQLNRTLTILQQINATLLSNANNQSADSVVTSLIELLAYATPTTTASHLTTNETVANLTSSSNEGVEVLRETDTPLDELSEFVEIEEDHNPS